MPQPDIQDILMDEQNIDEAAKDLADANPDDPNPDEPDNPTPDDPDPKDPADPDNEPDDPDEPEDPIVEEPKPFEEKDLFIEIEGYVGDSEEVTKIKVRSYEDIPEDFNHKDNKAFAKFQGDYNKLMRDQESQAKEKSDYEAQEEQTKITNNTLKLWDSETQNLTKEGRLPEIKAKPGSKDFNKDPGVVRQSQVYGFIVSENQKRAKFGQPPIQSFEDALDKLENKEAREAKLNEDKREIELKKKRAGHVGKSKPGNPSANGKPGYVKGSGMDPMDILNDEMLDSED